MDHKILMPDITATQLTDSTTTVNLTAGSLETATIITEAINVLVQVKEESGQVALGSENDFPLFQTEIANKISHDQ